MLAMQRNTGQTAPELEITPLLPGCQLIWDTFIDLHNQRGGGMGPLPIGWRDLSAWQELRQVRLTAWEIDTLLAMDSVALKSMGESKT